MNIVNVIENDLCVLPSNVLILASEIKTQNPTLPFLVEKNGIRFNEYIIGSLKIGDFLINIQPRHNAISTRKVFEMILYTSGIRESEASSGYEFSPLDGISVVPLIFILSCENLVHSGLTGGYTTRREISDIIRGSINYTEFHNKKILLDGGISCDFDLFSFDSVQNRVIKAALKKSLSLVSGDHASKIYGLQNYFENVSDELLNTEHNEDFLLNIYSLNPHYKETIKYALIILNDMKLSYTGTAENDWYSFLINSNTLFEEFIRKVIMNSINENVEKWVEPKPFATVEYEDNLSQKTFVPDIVINYNENISTATAVFDVKNKSFEPSSRDLAGLVSSPDLYQLLFYCRQLRTKIGGIIYPSSDDFKLTKVNVSNENDNSIYLVAVNMKDSNFTIENKLKNNINKILQRT